MLMYGHVLVATMASEGVASFVKAGGMVLVLSCLVELVMMGVTIDYHHESKVRRILELILLAACIQWAKI